MRMLVMRIVNVRVSVLQEIVLMIVFVNFSQVQPNAERHQQSRDGELKGDSFAKQQHSSRRPEKRGRREIGSGTRRAQMPERKNEKNQADTIPEKPHQSGKHEWREGRQAMAEPKPEREIDRTRDQPLQLDDLQGISQ